jgi:hypothetical protein
MIKSNQIQSSYHGYSGVLFDTSCAAGFRRSVHDEMVCADGTATSWSTSDGKRYFTCCLPNVSTTNVSLSGVAGGVNSQTAGLDDDDILGTPGDGCESMVYFARRLCPEPNLVLELAVVIMVVTHTWAEVAQQWRIARRVEYENLGQWFIEVLSRYTNDIWNILDTAALLTAIVGGVTRGLLQQGFRILSPEATADIHMFAVVLGFLRIMTVLQVFEFSGSQTFQILIHYSNIILVMVISSKRNYACD